MKTELIESWHLTQFHLVITWFSFGRQNPLPHFVDFSDSVDGNDKVKGMSLCVIIYVFQTTTDPYPVSWSAAEVSVEGGFPSVDNKIFPAWTVNKMCVKNPSPVGRCAEGVKWADEHGKKKKIESYVKWVKR